jgi:CHAT domain
MTRDSEIRRVTVEFLRRGPRHNQLLSPLTDYLAVCEDFPAGVVHVPYEHAEVQVLLSELRYEVPDVVESARLRVIRERVGENIATMLATISGLPGSLRNNDACLTHLRLVMSAAELAMLPFEMAKLPVGPLGNGEEWLGLQSNWPVCITRGVRGIRTAARRWPKDPRILFVAGRDVPFTEHLRALADVLRPWETIEVDPEARKLTSKYLTACDDVTVDDLAELMQDGGFTHVHVLAHGAELDAQGERHGLELGDRVISGADLALALTTAENPSLPVVVTVAACDSGQQGSVILQGGTVAYELHTAGVMLVIASQFPMSEQASVPFARTLFQGFLSGTHPLHSIAALRRRLAVGFPDEHAWAGVIVYEDLPPDFDDQLAEVRYWQTRRAMLTTVDRLRELTGTADEPGKLMQDTGSPFPEGFPIPRFEDYGEARDAVAAAMSALPRSGPWSADSAGLLAAARKRTAEVAFWLSRAPDLTDAMKSELEAQSIEDLQESLTRYTSAMKLMLGTISAAVHEKASPHWLMGQILVLHALLGQGRDENLYATTELTARLALEDHEPGERGWANGTLLEFHLLKLATAEPPPVDAAERAVAAAKEIVRLCGIESEQVFSTLRQMRRYVYWWGHPDFRAALSHLGPSTTMWEERGVLAAAERIIAIFTPNMLSVHGHASGEKP